MMHTANKLMALHNQQIVISHHHCTPVSSLANCLDKPSAVPAIALDACWNLNLFFSPVTFLPEDGRCFVLMAHTASKLAQAAKFEFLLTSFWYPFSSLATCTL
jgi:hypothetical protein